MTDRGVTPELFAALGAMVVGILAAVGSFVTVLRRLSPSQARVLHKRLRTLEAAVIARDRHIWDLERALAGQGVEPPPRPWAERPRRRREAK